MDWFDGELGGLWKGQESVGTDSSLLHRGLRSYSLRRTQLSENQASGPYPLLNRHDAPPRSRMGCVLRYDHALVEKHCKSERGRPESVGTTRLQIVLSRDPQLEAMHVHAQQWAAVTGTSIRPAVEEMCLRVLWMLRVSCFDKRRIPRGMMIGDSLRRFERLEEVAVSCDSEFLVMRWRNVEL